MKMFILSAMAGLLMATLTGCVGPQYGDKSQYDKGDWHFLANNRQVHERSQQQLALAKLQAQPVTIGTMTATGVVVTVVAPGATASAGYEGIVANHSHRRRYNFLIQGVENRSFYLGPGERITEYLLPGRYVAAIYYGGRQEGRPYVFNVSPQKKTFLGKECHWYLAAEW